jgi:hypothetical protein
MRILTHRFTLLTLFNLLAWLTLSASGPQPGDVPELEPTDDQEIDDIFAALETGDNDDDDDDEE